MSDFDFGIMMCAIFLVAVGFCIGFSVRGRLELRRRNHERVHGAQSGRAYSTVGRNEP